MRDAGVADLDAVLELNNAAVPNVNQLERGDLERIVALAAYYRDRVVVAERVRGQGVGAALYDDMHAFAATQWPRVALEYGESGDNRVAMYVRDV